jgi:hypothetical protein
MRSVPGLLHGPLPPPSHPLLVLLLPAIRRDTLVYLVYTISQLRFVGTAFPAQLFVSIYMFN